MTGNCKIPLKRGYFYDKINVFQSFCLKMSKIIDYWHFSLKKGKYT